MKKNIILLGAIAISSLAFSQVGINTETPQATLDVAIKTTGASLPEGIIAPRLTGDEIKSRDTLYDTPQKGAIVYATAPVGTASTKTANITAEGYYYFDGNVWTKFGSGTGTGTSTPEPWYIQNTTTPASANTQNIYQNGKVAVGFSNTDAVSGKQLEVKGDLKSLYRNPAGDFYSVINTNMTDYGIPMSDIHVADAAELSNAGKISGLTLNTMNAQIYTNYLASGSHTSGGLTSTSTTNGSDVRFQSVDTTGNISSTVIANSNTTGNNVMLIQEQSGSAAVQVTLERTKGVTYDFKNSGGILEGSYTFPRTNGSSNQVLTTDGISGNATLSWKDASSLSPEPWRIQGTTNAATANTQNIYQIGNVSIGSQTPIATFTSNSVTVTPKLSIAGDVASTGAFYTTTGKYADYVFEDYFDGASKINDTYKFRSLEETAAYIKENKHLPGVTSIRDILKTENGYTVNLSELSIQQLEKIEELYLHTIEQQQEITKQKTEINDLISRLEKLEQLLIKEKNNK
ncbi:MAG: hypothetical protein E2590_10065 [Chryseobacterium sp.]|nr:hypothetical protein [Chryseobacterium sp.]